MLQEVQQMYLLRIETRIVVVETDGGVHVFFPLFHCRRLVHEVLQFMIIHRPQ